MITTSGGRVDVGDARREAEHEPADDEQDRIRDAQRVGEQEQRQSRIRSSAGAEALRVRRTPPPLDLE